MFDQRLRHSVTDCSQVPEQILEWNKVRTPDRYVKASVNCWYSELRKQNDAPTLLRMWDMSVKVT